MKTRDFKVIGREIDVFVSTKSIFIDTYSAYATHIFKTHGSLVDYEYIMYIKPKLPVRKTRKSTMNIGDIFEISIISEQVNQQVNQKSDTADIVTKEKILIIVGCGLSVAIHDILSDEHSFIGYWVDESATCTVFYKKDLVQESLDQENSRNKSIVIDKNIIQDSAKSAKINCYAQRHSSLTVYFLIAGAAESDFVDFGVFDMQLNCYLLGEYADIKVDGAYMLSKKQKATVSLYQEHLIPHTSSNVLVKSVLRDSAYICYKGLIYIGTNAPYTDAVQNNKNIIVAGNGDSMANNNARAHSIPSLEILNNEVRCAHGSAVGPVDKEQLFVLQSRGLDQMVATEILINGFIGTNFNSLWHSN